MASFQTNPERGVQNKTHLGRMTSKMFVRMTDKQTKPEGSSGAKEAAREMKVWTNTPASERIWRQYFFSFSLVIWRIWSAKLSVVSGCTGIPSQATMRMLCCVGRRRSVFVCQIRAGFQGRADGLFEPLQRDKNGILELIMAKFTASAKKSYKVRSSCSHSAWIVFSMDFLQTSPEWGVHNKTQLLCLLRCLCYWMTSKQSQKVVQGPKDYNCKFSLSFLKAKSLSFHSLTWIKPDRWKSGMQLQVSAFDSSIFFSFSL